MKGAALLLLGLAAAGAGKVFLTREQALAKAFGAKAEVQSKDWWWTEEQRAALAELAGVDADEVAARHRGWYVGEEPGGTTAWFDGRQVRTKRMGLMFTVRDDGTLGEVRVCSFGEPLEYLPSEKWLEQFEGKRLDDELALKRGVHGITGATLTAQATVAAAREVLAARATAFPQPEPEPDPAPPAAEPAPPAAPRG